jgi:hypothetical protein
VKEDTKNVGDKPAEYVPRTKFNTTEWKNIGRPSQGQENHHHHNKSVKEETPPHPSPKTDQPKENNSHGHHKHHHYKPRTSQNQPTEVVHPRRRTYDRPPSPLASGRRSHSPTHECHGTERPNFGSKGINENYWDETIEEV